MFVFFFLLINLLFLVMMIRKLITYSQINWHLLLYSVSNSSERWCLYSFISKCSSSGLLCNRFVCIEQPVHCSVHLSHQINHLRIPIKWSGYWAGRKKKCCHLYLAVKSDKAWFDIARKSNTISLMTYGSYKDRQCTYASWDLGR